VNSPIPQKLKNKKAGLDEDSESDDDE